MPSLEDKPVTGEMRHEEDDKPKLYFGALGHAYRPTPTTKKICGVAEAIYAITFCALLAAWIFDLLSFGMVAVVFLVVSSVEWAVLKIILVITKTPTVPMTFLEKIKANIERVSPEVMLGILWGLPFVGAGALLIAVVLVVANKTFSLGGFLFVGGAGLAFLFFVATYIGAKKAWRKLSVKKMAERRLQ